MAAVKHDWRQLQYASAELKDDREIVMEAVKQNGRALSYASAELQDDEEFQNIAARRSPPSAA